jgi:GntR family transcriptional regulator
MIVKNHPIPLYFQIKQDIFRRIQSGEWKPNDLIPSERELCNIYTVSRGTVRQAISEMVFEGLLWRDQGRGTFVSKPKIKKLLSRLTGFTEDMKELGMVASAKVIRLELFPAGEEIAQALKISEGQSVVLIERLRLADGEPIGLERAHLFFEGCKDLLSEDLTGSLYELLTRKFIKIPTEAEEQLEAGACGIREAELLGIRMGDPVMLLRRTTFNQDMLPFEYVESVYKSGKYIYQTKLKMN